jgi:hypothetical protein
MNFYCSFKINYSTMYASTVRVYMYLRLSVQNVSYSLLPTAYYTVDEKSSSILFDLTCTIFTLLSKFAETLIFLGQYKKISKQPNGKQWTCMSEIPFSFMCCDEMHPNNWERGAGMDQITIKTPNPKCRLYWCLIEFIDCELAPL